MKEDLQGINIRKDRKEKKEKYCSTFIWNRIIRTGSNWKNQYFAKKLAQTHWENMLKAESTKEQNIANQAVK